MISCADLQLLLVEPNEIFRLGLLSIVEKIEGLHVRKVVSRLEELASITPEDKDQVLILTVTAGSIATLVAIMDKFRLAKATLKVVCLSSAPTLAQLNELTAIGVSAYCCRDISVELFSMAIGSVRSGGLWICPIVMKMVNADSITAGDDSAESLSERELEVLSLLSLNMPNGQIAKRLGISQETVKTHVRHILSKLAVPGRGEAAAKARELGLISGIE